MRVLSGVCCVAHNWEQGKYHGYLGKLFFFFPQELCKNGISGCWGVCPSVSLINHSDVSPKKHWAVRGHISRVKKILTCDLSIVSTNQDFEKEDESPSVNKMSLIFTSKVLHKIISDSLIFSETWNEVTKSRYSPGWQEILHFLTKSMPCLSSSGWQVWAFLWVRQRRFCLHAPHCIFVGPFSSFM